MIEIEVGDETYHVLGKTALICYEYLTIYQCATLEGDTIYFGIPENFLVYCRCCCDEMLVSFDAQYLLDYYSDHGRYEYSRYLIFQ